MVEMREWEIRPRREGGIQEKLRGLGSWEKRDQSSVQRSEQRAKGLVAICQDKNTRLSNAMVVGGAASATQTRGKFVGDDGKIRCLGGSDVEKTRTPLPRSPVRSGEGTSHVSF